MNDRNVRCSDERLLALLHSDQDGDEVRDAAAHLERCPRCQERLEALAAKPQDWRSAHECLALDDGGESHDRDDQPRGAWATMHGGRVPSEWSESMAKRLLAPPSHPEMLGRIGRYEVERVIGAGGMGVVFKAFDTELNRSGRREGTRAVSGGKRRRAEAICPRGPSGGGDRARARRRHPQR